MGRKFEKYEGCTAEEAQETLVQQYHDDPNYEGLIASLDAKSSDPEQAVLELGYLVATELGLWNALQQELLQARNGAAWAAWSSGISGIGRPYDFCSEITAHPVFQGASEATKEKLLNAATDGQSSWKTQIDTPSESFWVGPQGINT